MKGYGSNDPTTTPSRDGNNKNGSSYATPIHQEDRPVRASLPRNESAGGATIHTTETEPLLGEQLLLGNDDEEDKDPKSMFLSSEDDADISTIEKVGSDPDEFSTPRQSGGSPRKQTRRPGNDDPHIGLNVITSELDTLAYSRDPDESTLLTNDNFTRKNTLTPLGEDFEEGGTEKGLLRRLFSKSGSSSDPPYKLVGLGLAVGVGLCSIAALAYVEYNHHHGTAVLSTDANATSSEGTWHGVPYNKIGRESFGDPVSNIMDVSLFHPSLLFGGHYVPTEEEEGKKSTTTSASAKTTGAEIDNDDANRKLSNDASPKPFLRVPFPTGAFWTNLVMLPRNKKKTKNKNQYSYPIVAYPYAYQWAPVGKLQASYSASRRVIQSNSIQDGFAPDISFGSVEDIHTRHVVRFDSLSVTLRFYSDGDSNDGGGSGGNWETYIVQGSPYITAKYSGLAPELTALSDFVDIACPPTFEGEDPAQFQQPQPQGEGDSKQPSQQQQHRRTTSSSAPTTGKKLGICAITKNSSKQKKIITGVQFVVTTKEHLTWLVFASEPITFEFDQAARRTIYSKEQYEGVIRLALVPPAISESSTATTTSTLSGGTTTKSLDFDRLASSPGVKRLIYHAGAYPVGGTVSWDFRSGARSPLASSTFPNISPNNKGHGRRALSEQNVRRQHRRTATAEAPKENNIGRVTFAFDTIHTTSSSQNSNIQLLMLSLPHHAASISSAEKLMLRHEDFDLVYQSIKGHMVAVVGNTWSYEEELTFMGFGDESLPAKANIAQHSTSSASGTSATSHHPIIHESTAISTLDQSIRDLLLQTVESDLKVNLPVLTNGAYGFGKQIARMAQLAHIAEVVDAANVREVDELVDRIKNTKNSTSSQASNNPASSASSTSTTSVPSMDKPDSATGSGTTRRAYALLEKYLAMWLIGDGSDKHLAYDAELGGILSKEGMTDMNADFGNARYNDHHFHYGYVLYAAAILGRANPKFITQYGPFVDALFYDVAHNSGVAKPNNDKKEIFFPLARHKSWFDGHSFASGLFTFADGKSQESSSEAVNCYYGAYLWSRVRWGGGTNGGGDRKMVDFARLLLAMEVTGAKTYWHMTPPKESTSGSGTKNNTTTLASTGGSTSLVPVAYDNSAFRENYMVGNLGMTDVTCTTWFGTENIYVHLINFLPVTAITAELFDKSYVKGEQSALKDSKDSVEKAWKGYSICNEAIIDPNNAWIEAQSLVSRQLDPGLSKSQVLFWASTREGFSTGTTVDLHDDDATGTVPDRPVAPSNNKNSGATTKRLASCSSHEKCVAENLAGSCCPTHEGVFLRCCT
mmetsp:Transcript_32239/g.56125  ORF Transcript_32239/g.56125 Transcript_32239/m.56125 type:complete len:1316 (+) Transcript_32239:58-4005(+)